MRGKLLVTDFTPATGGITPADAGKTFCRRLPRADTRDHPRGCGENVTAFDGQPLELGITPADAGKTAVLARHRQGLQDHPRGCGENRVHREHQERIYGSPPRMRGKLWMSIAALIVYGITPADAGKTCPQSLSKSSSQDHPRGCGENRQKGCGYRRAGGSPPRMRGKLSHIPPNLKTHRITPADAGKTIFPQSCRRHSRDHPRGCGENLCWM